MVRACTYHTRAMRHIRPLLTVAAAKSIATSIVGDWTIVTVYCTAPDRNATRIDFSGYRINLRVLYCRHHGQPVLQICAVNYIGCQQDNGLLSSWQRSRTRHDSLESRNTYIVIPGITNPCRTLRSTSALLLQPPATIALAAMAFCVAAPTVWNSLDVHTRSADTFLTFKNRLKTELFKSCYV